MKVRIPVDGGFQSAEGCLSVVIPLYNERSYIEEILRRVLERPEVGEVIVVDDASTDGSAEVVERLALPKVRLLRQPQNRGKGAAVRRGFEKVGLPYVLVQDADLEYRPADYPKLLAPVLSGRSDVVYGDRFAAGKPPGMSPLYYAANRFLTGLSNLTTGYRLRDVQCCYKVLPSRLLPELCLVEERFAFEPELTRELARLAVRLIDVPVMYEPRSHSEGKKIGWVDGLRAMRAILARSPRRGAVRAAVKT